MYPCCMLFQENGSYEDLNTLLHEVENAYMDFRAYILCIYTKEEATEFVKMHLV